jgi:hypothetical protein
MREAGEVRGETPNVAIAETRQGNATSRETALRSAAGSVLLASCRAPCRGTGRGFMLGAGSHGAGDGVSD